MALIEAVCEAGVQAHCKETVAVKPRRDGWRWLLGLGQGLRWGVTRQMRQTTRGKWLGLVQIFAKRRSEPKSACTGTRVHGHALGGRKRGQKPGGNNPDAPQSGVRRNSTKYQLHGRTRRECSKRPFAAPKCFCKCSKWGVESFLFFYFLFRADA